MIFFNLGKGIQGVLAGRKSVSDDSLDSVCLAGGSRTRVATDFTTTKVLQKISSTTTARIGFFFCVVVLLVERPSSSGLLCVLLESSPQTVRLSVSSA